MSIIRTSHNKENPYALLNRESINDADVSWAAKGLWMYLISKSDNWNVSVKNLVKTFHKGKKGGGERAIYSLLKELIEKGYCLRMQHKDSKGLFSTFEYIILEEKKLKETLPHSSKSKADKLKIESPHSGYRDVDKSDLTKVEILPIKDVCIVCSDPKIENEKAQEMERLAFKHRTKNVVMRKISEIKEKLEGDSEGFSKKEIEAAIETASKMQDSVKLNGTIDAYVKGIILQTRKQKIKESYATNNRKSGLYSKGISGRGKNPMPSDSSEVPMHSKSDTRGFDMSKL